MSTLFKIVSNIAYTENGARAYKSTQSPLLDFFYNGYSHRFNPKTVISLVDGAMKEDILFTLRTIFYIRNFRNNSGCGERDVFRVALREFVKQNEPLFLKNVVILDWVEKYGRFDDILALIGISDKVDSVIGKYILDKLTDDMRKATTPMSMKLSSESPSLLAKWLPSANASKNTRALALKVIKLMNLHIKENSKKYTERRYRKTLSLLRKKIKIVEHNINEKNYGTINYSAVPSKAMKKYWSLFKKNDGERFESFIDSVNKGTAKINASTIFPHEIIKMCLSNSHEKYDALWNNLPDFFSNGSAKANWLPVIDVSGSMLSYNGSVVPIHAAIGLGLYIAERNTGIFKNEFVTFSENPSFLYVEGNDLRAKVKHIFNAQWGLNTNIEKVFDTLLTEALKHNIPEEEMPKNIIIISDMEFDCATYYTDKTAFESICSKYKAHGYTVPKIIFWNVSGNGIHTPVLYDTVDTILIGGYKPGMYDLILGSKTPKDFMNSVLTSDEYKDIVLNY